MSERGASRKVIRYIYIFGSVVGFGAGVVFLVFAILGLVSCIESFNLSHSGSSIIYLVLAVICSLLGGLCIRNLNRY